MKVIIEREFLTDLIEVFEEFLVSKGIEVPNPERKEDETASVIYGSDFGTLVDKIEEVARAYNIIPSDTFGDLIIGGENLTEESYILTLQE